MSRFFSLTFSLLLFVALSASVAAQPQTQTPLTNDEFVRLVRQLPGRPDLREQLIEEIRVRGINFPLTSGLRSLVATKSGNDADLRRMLEEAERRRLNPTTTTTLPPEREALDLLAKTREATLAAAEEMPDFVVRQQIRRLVANGTTRNWVVQDRLTVAVSYRPSDGEQYRVLAINGAPTGAEARESNSYSDFRGTSSTGEYVTRLAALFRAESKTEFQPIDTDTVRGRRVIVYKFNIKKSNSRSVVSYGRGPVERSVVVGVRGRIWVDGETFRVLRLEEISTDLPRDFPVEATSNVIDYDWVTIAERKYLLPMRAVIEMSGNERDRIYQTRNEVNFRNYQKYGSEVKIIEEEIEDETPPEKKP